MVLGGPATSAGLYLPIGAVVDPSGNLYIADWYNNRIRKVSGGVITTVAGIGGEGGVGGGYSGDNGPATSAQLSIPTGVALDSAGNLFIADYGNNRVRKVANGVITTVAGTGAPNQPGGHSGDNGPAVNAQLLDPFGVAVDSTNNLYISELAGGCIRKVSGGVITTVTCVVPGLAAGLTVDSSSNLYVGGSFEVFKVSNGTVTTIAGTGLCCNGNLGDNGPALTATVYNAYGVAVDSSGNVYIADGDRRVRRVANGVITTVAGSATQGFGGDNGPATSAELDHPNGVAVGSGGKLYIADGFNNRIRLLTPGTVPTVTPGGVVPVYSPTPIIQPGSWVSLYGSNLANGSFVWNGDFPTSLGGTSVTINGKLAYLWSVSPTQINLQAPDDTATGVVSVSVNTANGPAASTVTLAAQSPSFNLLGDGEHVAGEILTPSGTGAYGGGAYDLVGPSNAFSYSTRPVKAGETLVLYGVGFGPTTPSVLAGRPFSGAASTNSLVTITIGGVKANVAFAGITEAGLYQFNLTVPSGTGSGDRPLTGTVNGVQTPSGPVVTIQ